jgi:anti-sigma B factor antagonist
MSFVIKAEKVSDRVNVLRVVGRITGGGAAEFTTEMKRLVQPDVGIILDLSELQYIDSSGVSTIVVSYMDAQRVGATVVLAAVPERIRSILKLTRLESIFTIYETVDQARLALAPA